MKNGFSKLTKEEKINWLVDKVFINDIEAKKLLEQYQLSNSDLQKIHDDFSENTLSNFLLPLGVAPNFLIDGKDFILPMVVEESSVVAAASNASKFWCQRGGFKTKVINTIKVGQVHLMYKGNPERLKSFFDNRKNVSRAIDIFIKNLRSFKTDINSKNNKSILKKLIQTKKVRSKIIKLKQDVNKPDFGRD